MIISIDDNEYFYEISNNIIDQSTSTFIVSNIIKSMNELNINLPLFDETIKNFIDDFKYRGVKSSIINLSYDNFKIEIIF